MNTTPGRLRITYLKRVTASSGVTGSQDGQVQVGDDIPMWRTSGRSGDLRFGTRRHLHLLPDFFSDGPGIILVLCIDGQA
jgi:hypothetical protein